MAEHKTLYRLGGRSPRVVKKGLACLVLATIALADIIPSVEAQDAAGDAPGSPAGQVPHDELGDFAVAYLEVRLLRAELDRDITELIEESGLSRDRLYEIQDRELKDVTEAEERAYETVMARSTALQERSYERMLGAVREAGLSIERFEEITRSLNADPDLAQRAQAHIDRLVSARADALDLDLEESEPED
ncbi:MAG: DUF4168 domain-containing protein [Spirochaetota bacterium]